jgi:hypothetical protein
MDSVSAEKKMKHMGTCINMLTREIMWTPSQNSSK